MTEPKKSRSRWRLVLEIGLIVVLFLAFRAWQHRDAPDGPAPSLTGPGLAGETITLAERPSQPVLVHFWATWCGVCAAEEDNIDGLAEDHTVITVAAQSGDASDVAAYLEREDLDFPVVLDPEGAIAHRWGVSAFPTSFVIGTDGTIRSVEVGYTTSLGLRARMWLASAL